MLLAIVALSTVIPRLRALVFQSGVPKFPLQTRPITTSTAMGSTFKKPPQAPPLFTHTPETIVSNTKKLLASTKALQDQIVKDVTLDTANFKNVALPFAQDDNNMALETHIIGFYQAISTDVKKRDASTEAEKLMDDFSIESAMREDIFQLVDAAFKKQKDDTSLDAESRRLLEKDHKGYIRMGLGIPAGPDRDRFKAIKKRQSDWSITFSKNF